MEQPQQTLAEKAPSPVPHAPSRQDTLVEEIVEETPRVDPEKAVPTDDGPPDGGWRAWLVVFGCACSGFSTFGFANAYGVFQAYYVQTLPGATPSAVAWIGSLQYCLIFLPGFASGWLVDRGYFRLPLIVASIVQITAIFLVAECKELWQLVLCQGFAVGLAAGFIFLPSLSVVPQWFNKKRARAYGFIAVGSSIGGTILPIIIRKLLVAVGFKWTIRILGFIIATTMAAFHVTMRERVKSTRKGQGSDVTIRSLLELTPLLWYTGGVTLIWLGLYAPLQFFDASAQHIGISKDISYYTIVTANAASAIGRVTAGFWADSFGVLNVLIIFSLISALMIFVWPYAETFASMLVVAAIYGVTSGAFVSLLPAGSAQIVPQRQLGRAIGLSISITSLGALVGNPIAGRIYSASGGYEAVGGFAGSIVVLACVAIGTARYYGLGKWIGKY